MATEIHEIIARLSFEANVEAGNQAVDVLSKQDNIINEMTSSQKKLGDAIQKTADPKVVKELTKQYDEAGKVIQKTQKTVQDQIKKTTDTIQKSINGIDFGKFKNIFTGAEFTALDEQINNAKTDMAQLAILTEAFKDKLGVLSKGSQEFDELNAIIKVSEATLKEYATATELANGDAVRLDATFEQIYGDLQPLNTRIGELEDRMYELALSNHKNTDEYKELEKELIRYKKIIKEVDDSVDASVETSKGLKFIVEGSQAVAAGFEIGAGAAALFGLEQEELEKVQTKLLSIMAVANGLEQISILLKKESALATIGHELATKAAAVAQSAYSFIVGTSTGALKAFRIALATTGIGAIVVAIGLLVANWEELTSAIGESNNELKLHASIIDKASEGYANAVQDVNQLKIALDLNKEGFRTKDEVVKQYNETIGKTTGAIKSLDEAETFIKDNAQAYIEAQFAKAKATAALALASEKARELIKLETNAELSAVDKLKLAASGTPLANLFGFGTGTTASGIVADRKKAIEGVKKDINELNKLAFKYSKEAETTGAKAGLVGPSIDVDKTKANLKKDKTKANLKKDITKAINKSIDELSTEEDLFKKNFKRVDVDLSGLTFFDKTTPLPSLSFDTKDAIDNINYLAKIEVDREARIQQEKDDARAKDKQRYKQSIDDATNATQKIIQQEIARLDGLERAQQQRVADAEKNAGEVADVSVKAEMDRLQKIQQEREKFARAQRLIDAATIVANQAVAVSEAVKGLAKAAAEGGGIASAFTVGAYIASIAAGTIAAIAAVRSVDIPQFYEGGYTGDGNPRDTSNAVGPRPYQYHKGEFVMNNHLTSSYRDMFDALHNGNVNVTKDMNGVYTLAPKQLDVNKIAKDHANVTLFYNGVDQKRFEAMTTELSKIHSLLQEREVKINNNFDARGFGMSVAYSIGRAEIKNKGR